ncbi:uncharacterized protein BT62DRAFT_959080 [Guyanagaster necrorhizus]|uniref:dual-specificity kinase n=1 Tax=Guyanagaster necrorhizus TaxID=856835 RepID=A0A9P8B0C8_9AGAR|nr:uncharacterized protein BT62DRAFT_959080 [Guyanagaster necrorhizus MCA 3950]KAG7452947.1 hypothetical protein BT62DRAFT_959080 [Guyanagaster necrorhizus MCA 3950]
MSTSPSPVAPNTSFKRRERPPTLEINTGSSPLSSDLDNRDERDDGFLADSSRTVQPSVLVSPAQELPPMDSDYPASRSTSTTSSLDPYYFGLQSGSDSPYPPPLPTAPSLRATPESRPITEPVTPARDPANIDRRGLVGVGELATPRWTRSNSGSEEKISIPEALLENEPYQVVDAADATEDDVPDSPWTIEAVDGESSEKEDVVNMAPVSHPLRARPSITEESGGEEILYPRKAAGPAPKLPKPTFGASFAEELSPQVPELSLSESSSPPSAFSHPVRRAKKRSSDEFELDQTGSLVSKHVGSKAKEEKPSTRRHRSLNSGSISTSTRESKIRKRESISLSTSSNVKTAPPAKEKHTRQASASSSSSSYTDVHPRRVHTTDFSHLPPSPSSSSIQQFLRHASSNGLHTPPLNPTREPHLSHNSANVAHSLLRGTQEGWSGMDDEATAEALRKLDGLSGRSARTRASVGSLGRPLSLSRPGSRPGTPAKIGNQREGVGEGKPNRTASTARERDLAQRQLLGLGLHAPEDSLLDVEPIGSAISSDEQQPPYPHLVEKTPKKNGTGSARSSFTPKRGSASSTTYGSTPTTSSRDSAQMSAATSATSVSAASLRKARRNSAGSDISSVHSSDATSLKDRVASLAVNGDTQDDADVPPVPPLPKDLLSAYRSPPSTAAGATLPSPAIAEDEDKRISHEHSGSDRLEIPSVNPSLEVSSARRQSQHNSSGYTSSSMNSAPESTPVVHKTPSKKWSFSNALNLMSGSPSSSSHRSSAFPLSPRAVTFGQQIRRSTSKDQALSHSVPPSVPWSPTQPDAMASVSSLASLSSIGSVRTPAPAPPSKTPERGAVASRSGTDSSASTSHTFALAAPQAPLSPSSSVRRGQSKRLTPSSIPFFRRSSSQSMQLPPSSIVTSSSPTLPGNSAIMLTSKRSTSPGFDYNPPSTSAHKKSSMLSLGLPSLLKGSSSRKSLHSDSRESVKDSPRKDSEKARLEKKKEDKERSESRISVLMGRKRGKTVSSTDPRKPKSPVNLPPMQMSALEPATAQRVARLKASNSSSTSTPARGTSSRATAQTMSSMQKQSDASLRSRNQLPTIAGSPSVGNVSKDLKEPAPSPLTNSILGHPKETPTKIPRISSRTSAAPSPPLKGSLTLSNRRTSMTVNAIPTSVNPSPTELNEFGVMDSTSGARTGTGSTTKGIRSSPSTLTTSRVPRQASGNASSTSGVLPRKSNRDSISFTGLRKSSTSSVASLSTSAAATDAPPVSHHHHRFSALSPSKGLKLLSPKISLPTARSSNSTSTHNIHQAIASASSSRQSLSTPSPAPSSVDEEELLGDEEMMHYIKRQQAKKIANGATQEELDELLRFPEPLPPGKPSSPLSIIKGSQSQYLSDYERKEILDFPSVYCIGARSKKKMASPDNSSNNYGYDDERGDYQVINHDHLAYRYEVIDTLGKGSFGQVLHCRDHCSGESVAIKIIRNKKRFHHQALVEIKILDNLRKWDEDEKHHVIKMTEHFYFRNHLCIAMELLSINLYELIKANGFVGFTTALIRRFTSQMLMSLSLMRHHRIVHCDLKPENVLLRHPAKSGIKVIDFGSSCFETEKIYTYIQSRFYRSPEVILGMNYHMAIDMWSLGCILAELYTGFPIFPGENEQEQLSCIMEVLGTPDKDFVNKSSRKKLFFDPSGAPRLVTNSKGRRRRPGSKTLAQVLRCNDDDFVDFISKCLVWDPERRIKPASALRHPFVTGGRRTKVLTSTSKSTLSTPSLSSRRKDTTETPKKSLISAPTPLTARSSRATGSNAAPPTPSNSSHASTLGTSRSYRASQPQSLSTYHSSRTLNGYATATAK